MLHKKTCDLDKNKRIFITNVNGLLGHSLFELMRNDYIKIKSDDPEDKPHRFVGTLNEAQPGEVETKSPAECIKIIDSKAKPKTFSKQIRAADFIVLDVSQFNCDLDEAELALSALKAPGDLDQVLLIVSSPMVWSNSKGPKNGQAFTDDEAGARVPLPKYQRLKQIETAAFALTKKNPRLRVHVMCSGFLYGNGE